MLTTFECMVRRGALLARRALVTVTLLIPSLVPVPAEARQSPGAPQVQVLRIASTILHETRVVHVAVPANYSMARQPYPVVVLLDGQVRAFLDITMAGAAYDLTGAQHPVAVPPQIIVAVEQDDRQIDLARNAAAFRQFLVDELLPRIERQYRTLPYRTLIGHSLGGRFALSTMCQTPEPFANIIAISPSLPDSLAESVVACVRRPAPELPVRQLVISAGSLEARALTSSTRLLDSLRVGTGAAWRLHRVDATGLDHTGTPLITIPLGLRFAFGEAAWGLPAAQRDSLEQRLGDPDAVLQHGVAQRAARLGAAIPASADELARVVRSWLARRDQPRSVASARALTESHPEYVDAWVLLHQAYQLAGNAAEARRALDRALTQSGRVFWFDETQKARFQEQVRRLLRDGAPGSAGTQGVGR